jgi:tripartite-type tricarboxylate transporter receptor subunit TctC
MQFRKRDMIALALASGTFPWGAIASDGETEYPQRAITLVIGYPPGGEADSLARLLSMHMSVDLGYKMLVDYRPGAAGNIGAETVSRRAPDGYTIYLASRPNTIHKVMYGHLNYDFSRDLVPIGLVATIPHVIVAGKHAQIHNLQDMIRLAKKFPGSLSCASTGIATTSHLLCEMLQQEAHIEMLHVPYRGSAAALTDVISGRVDVQVAALAAALPHINAGALKPIAVMTRLRVPAIRDVPTIEEAGLPGLDLESWFGLVAPAGTPPDVIARLNRSINSVLMNADFQNGLVQRAYSAPLRPNTPSALKSLIVEETERWTAIVRSRNIKPLH